MFAGHTWISTLLGLFWLSIVFPCCATSLSSLSAAATLHVDGAQLKDAAGRIVLLRGINQPGFLATPDGAWDPPGQPLFSGLGHWNPAVVKGTLEEYRRLGFNVLRFHTIVEWWKTNPQTYQDPWRKVTYSHPYQQMLKNTSKSGV